jgi:hypothetical protein
VVKVAVPSYDQDNSEKVVVVGNPANTNASQSHRTNQGHSEDNREDGPDHKAGESQSRRADEGNSERDEHEFAITFLTVSQSHRIDQGNPDTTLPGQIFALRILLTSQSQSHRTDQGNSEGTVYNPELVAHEVWSQSHRTDQAIRTLRPVRHRIPAVRRRNPTVDQGNPDHAWTEESFKSKPLGRNPTVLIRTIRMTCKITNARFIFPKRGRNPTVLIRAIRTPEDREDIRIPEPFESQFHRTNQGNPKNEFNIIAG